VADSSASNSPVKKPAEQENIKRASNFLRGTILQSFENRITASVPDSDNYLLKFHGTYMQDNRDLRDERSRQRLEPAFDFMIRIRAAGGVVTPQQWLQLDALAHKYANGEIRLTTRQSFQFHGVLKWNLRQTIHDINQTLLDTLAACGDVNRNVMCNPNPFQSEVHGEIHEWAKRLSLHLAPRTRAYHEIWLGEQAVVPPPQDEEPMYGPTYLPRKFKIAIAVPPSNDVDVLAHDVGLIALVDDGRLVGFNVSVGGGFGMTHGEPATFPNLGWVIGSCRPEQVLDVAEKILATQRDFGDRSNRKHARLKYTILDRGVEWFKDELQRRLGWQLGPERPFHFEHHGDRYGWVKGTNSKWHLTLFIENGRIRDWEDYPLMTGLRTIAQSHDGDFRLTANQNLILGNVSEENRPRIEQLVQSYKLSDGQRVSALRRNAMACVALPTCGLAMAESERYLPTLITKLEGVMAEAGLANDEIVVRMTGCPNGCARPYLAEIGFVGTALGKYNLYLGADFTGTRLNRLYRENIGEAEILAALKPVISRYAQERQPGEHFGDFVVRVGYVRAVANGPDFHQIFIRKGEGIMNI
jgi:sulfite reductase (NADPH) hemoprotein beta-component